MSKNTQVICTFILFSLSVAAAHGGDATTALLEHLDKGGCTPSSLTGTTWTIGSEGSGTHGALRWGDRLEFEQSGRTADFDLKSSFSVWRNGLPWKAVGGWNGACVRNDSLSVYVISGKIEIEGCLHEIAFGRLDHSDSHGLRVEAVFEHAEEAGSCMLTHEHPDAVRHPGHTHGDDD